MKQEKHIGYPLPSEMFNNIPTSDKFESIDEEFDKSKLKWNGESMKYGDDWVGDTSGTKPNSDVDITCEYDSEKDGVSTYFSHSWY